MHAPTPRRHPRYFRPTEVEMMVDAHVADQMREKYLQDGG
jgi:hypothetical protein